MGDKSGIEWCDATWNPVRGCSMISDGCTNCYAMRQAARMAGTGGAYEGLVTARGPVWSGKVRVVPEKLWEPLRWTRPRRVFVNSMSDLFHTGVPFEFIAAVFGVMAAAETHTFQVLTKRPIWARSWFRWIEEQAGGAMCHAAWEALCAEANHHPLGDRGPLHTAYCADPEGPWPLPNVWLGVSVEDQHTADVRIPTLHEIPAVKRFISAEPLLGPVDLTHLGLENLSWVIVGGESGPRARPMDLKWARDIRAQCEEAGVPFFFKQAGGRTASKGGNRLDGRVLQEFPGATVGHLRSNR